MSPEKIKHQIRLWDKDAKNIEIVSSGATNLVGLTESAAYRFPFTDDALAIQLYEAELYKRLDDALNIPTPKLLSVYDDPQCIVITRLDGRHLSTSELAVLPREDMRNFIRQLLEFSLAINTVIDIETIRELENNFIGNKALERPWNVYLTTHLKEARFPDQLWLENLAHKQYDRWLDMQNSSTLPTIVVHDELHDANLLFSNQKISGIIDFGDTTIGTIAQELRQLLRISEDTVWAAINEYKALSGISIDFEEISTWAVAQELASYCRWFTSGTLDRPSFKRSRSNLQRMIAGFPG